MIDKYELHGSMVDNILRGIDNISTAKPNPRQCPNCGSTAQPYIVETVFEDQGDHIIKYITYHCGCKHSWLTSTVYKQEGEERIEDCEV
jgi:hypothetical protein